MRASFAKRDPEGGHWTRVLQSPFLFCLRNRFLSALPRGNRGRWQQGAGVERENKRTTEYNLPGEPAAQDRKGKRRREGPTGKETAPQPSTPPGRPEPPRSRPEPAALPRRRPRPPALPDPPRTRFLRSRTPALASPRDQAGQRSPLLGRGDSRRDVNTASQLRSAHPPCRGPSPRPPARPRAPRSPRAGAQRAVPFLQVPLPDRCPGRSAPCPSSRPLSPPQPPENPGANPGANNTGAGRGRGGRRRHSGQPGSLAAPSALPPTSRGCPRSYLLSASPGKTAASLSLPGRAADSQPPPPPAGRPEGAGPPRQPEPLHWERRRQNSGAPPRAAPPPAPPHRPPNRRGDGGDTEPGAGSNGGPRPRPAPGPRLPPPASAPPPRPPAAATRTLESASPTPPAPSAPPLPTRRGGGGDTASHRSACQTPAGYLYPAGPRSPRPPPAPPTCLSGSLESRSPLIPELLPNLPAQVDCRHLSRSLLGVPPSRSLLRPETAAGTPARGQARGGGGAARAPAAPPASPGRPGPRSHPRHSLRSPAGPSCHPVPCSGHPPISSRDSSALGHSDSYWGPGVGKTPVRFPPVSTPQPPLSTRWGRGRAGARRRPRPRARPGQ